MYPEWIKTFTNEFRAMMRRKAPSSERQALILRTEAENNLSGNTLMDVFLAYVDTPEGKVGEIRL